jgi:hypothetical protein
MQTRFSVITAWRELCALYIRLHRFMSFEIVV